jgi:2-polyprenyl-6-methoxyphenol hydroxylase-like FAD-dependent oxidoreductase
MNGMKVAIIGSGTAGAATGIFLSRAGHEVTVFERVESPQAIGAGIMMQPSGMDVLRALGLLNKILTAGARIDRLYAQTTSGRTVLDLPYASYDANAYGLGLHRGILFRTLFDALCQSGAHIHTGVEIVDLPVVAGGQSSLRDSHGNTFGPFDLVVVASGARTSLREAVGIPHRNRPYRWGALWFVADDPNSHFDGVLTQYLSKAHTMLGFLPTGHGPGSQIPLTSLFWSMPLDEVDAWRQRGLAAWREQLLSLEPKAEGLVAQIHDVDQVLFAPYFDVVMKRPFHGSVIFLGDSAHATSPQLGQGCNLALIDAWTLSQVVQSSGSIPEAFAQYERLRKGHIQYYQWASRALTPFFQSDSRVLPWLRDRFMGLACRLRPTARIMTASMCGRYRGFCRSELKPLALPEPDPTRPDL